MGCLFSFFVKTCIEIKDINDFDCNRKISVVYECDSNSDNTEYSDYEYFYEKPELI